MEDKKTFTRGNLISGAIGIVIMGVLYSLQDHSFVWIILCGALALGIMIVSYPLEKHASYRSRNLQALGESGVSLRKERGRPFCFQKQQPF